MILGNPNFIATFLDKSKASLSISTQVISAPVSFAIVNAVIGIDPEPTNKI